MADQKEKCEAFRDLHHTGVAFIVPNPWDIGSAKLLQGLGFKALATTSVGLASRTMLRIYSVEAVITSRRRAVWPSGLRVVKKKE